MKDIRDGDFSRKISEITGKKLFFGTYRATEDNFFAQYTNIKCYLFVNGIINRTSQEDIREKLSERINKSSIYEIHQISTLLTESQVGHIKDLKLDEELPAKEIIHESAFAYEVNEIIPEITFKRVMIYPHQKNEIEGLPEEIDEVTLIISAEKCEDIIYISDDDIIVID